MSAQSASRFKASSRRAAGSANPAQSLPAAPSTVTTSHSTGDNAAVTSNVERPVEVQHYYANTASITSTKRDRDYQEYEEEDYATQRVRERANFILDNHLLLMRYAYANDLSVPKTRVYFEKVAAGFSPKPIIKDWFPVS